MQRLQEELPQIVDHVGQLGRCICERSLLPSAVFIGFTGTPLLKDDKQTSLEVFDWRQMNTFEWQANAFGANVIVPRIYVWCLWIKLFGTRRKMRYCGPGRYHLPELLARPDERVYVTEGEKAADAAASIGLLATTSPHGCESAGKADWRPLAGRDVVILPDNDDAGRRYAERVTEILMRLRPLPKTKVVELPGLPEKGDMVEFVQQCRGAN